MTTTDGASSPWRAVVEQQSDAAVPEHSDSLSRSSIDRMTPPSRSSIELSPRPPGFLLLAQQSEMQVAKRKDCDTATTRKPQKKRKRSSSPRAASVPGSGENPRLTFLNMNLENWGKGNADAMSELSRQAQKGRKGALSEDTRASAQAVRDKGACISCHRRKVKCDEQRPCRNCEKDGNRLPQTVCCRVDDFVCVLLPRSIHEHLEKGQMNKFVSDNVESFTLNGIEQHCTVTLSLGPILASTLVVKASFFTTRPSTSDVLQHCSQVLSKTNAGNVEFEMMNAAPIGLDMDIATWKSLRKAVGDYVDSIVQEPEYAFQLTDWVRKTSLPREMLQIMHQYCQQSNSPIVKEALSIYTMQYIITRHLTLTPQSIDALLPINPVRAKGPYMTTRLLTRQIKAVTDELIRAKVTALLKEFSRRLKKAPAGGREEWAPCFASFTVLCMIMESMEVAADVLALAEQESEIRESRPAKFKRVHALEINKSIENMPFRQIAFQFHEAYRTISKDASAKSFNPLGGNNLDEPADLDSAARNMVLSLKNMMHAKCES
ncbi:hypothetical protein SLS53_006389 [Cytospora paraplurivora]|uniref:Zn(2)-C6 fungal-type domain-containing protein n=1 Tax=Cytospora paraplurivora TaxID=2898453 RepID=A0AAN9YDE8_9PEZI